MAYQLPQSWLTQLFDNFGATLVGGRILTYVAGTTTPKATFTDATGATPNSNPIILDSAGRADIWLNDDALYKFVVQTSAGVVLETMDGIGTVAAVAAANPFDVLVPRIGDGLATGEVLFAMSLVRNIRFPANFTGSGGTVQGNAPGATYSCTVRQNGVTIGTVSISTGKAFSFSTTGGTAKTMVAGEVLSVVGGTLDAALSDWSFTLRGDRT